MMVGTIVGKEEEREKGDVAWGTELLVLLVDEERKERRKGERKPESGKDDRGIERKRRTGREGKMVTMKFRGRREEKN